MIQLFAIYPTDDALRCAPTMAKLSSTTAAVIAFRDQANAELFIKEKLNNPNFSVQELTLVDFDRARAEEKAYVGVEVVIKIFD